MKMRFNIIREDCTKKLLKGTDRLGLVPPQPPSTLMLIKYMCKYICSKQEVYKKNKLADTLTKIFLHILSYRTL